MVVIRLARAGAKKRPFYQVVVTDHRSPRDGKFTERVGYYNPVPGGQEVKLKLAKDRIDHWLSKGAKLSERVSHLLAEYDSTPDKAT